MSRKWPIPMRLALGAAALLGVVVTYTLVVFFHMRAELMDDVDTELRAYVGQMTANPAPHQPGTLPPRIRIIPVQPQANENEISSESLKEELVARALQQEESHADTWRTKPNAWRLLWVTVDGHKYVLTYNLTEEDDVLRDLVVSCLVGGAVLIVLAAAVGWWWSGQVLSPVRALKSAVEQIGADMLHRRVPTPRTHHEMHDLGEELNAMLERIESAFLQSQRFTADASHELRTPLTIIRGEMDRLLSETHLEPQAEARLLRIQEATARLQSLTENLLLLARLDATPAPPPSSAEVNFSELVKEACEDGALLAEARGVALETDIDGDVRVHGDAEGLRRIVLNLLDNATRYNRPSGQVWCRLAAGAEGAILTIGNTGAGISEHDRGRLFQRFMRGDAARSPGGHGLGLALAYEIARSHGGLLRINEPRKEDLTEFVLVLK